MEGQMDKPGLKNVSHIQNRESRPLDQLDQGISAQIVRAQLEKILLHPGFRASQRLKKFLRYVVEETLDGHGEELKEYAIAIDVFQKDSSFDPRADNIVRVEAGRLRSRLAAYYEKEGIDDPIKIELVKGRYAPEFRTASEPGIDPIVSEGPKFGIQEKKGTVLPTAFAPLPQPASPEGSRSPVRFNRKLAVFTLAVLLVAGSIATWLLWKNAQPRTEMKSILVVPFQNLGDNKEDEFFSDGLSNDVIASLSHWQGLPVVARSSAFELKGKPINLPELSRQYKVSSVLEGTVQRYGDRWRITVQLVDSQSGYNLWSQIYDRDYKDVLTVQREISEAIAGALGAKLGAKVQPPDYKTTIARPEAYQDYLMGLYLWNTPNLSSEERLRQSITYFDRAIAKDANYAPAYVQLAKCYAAQWPTVEDPSANELIPKARTAALKALELDETQGEAYVVLGLISTYEFDWQKAEQNFKTALELVPGSAYAHQRYASYLMRVGRSAESSIQAGEAAHMDPVFLSRQGLALYQAREFEEAIGAYEKALVLNSDMPNAHDGLGMVYIQKRLFDKAIAELEKAGPSFIGDLGYGYAVSGDTERARQILTKVSKRANVERGSALAIARIYLGLGEKDKAFEWLSKAIDEQDFRLILPTDPVYDSLRSDPRFSDLLKQMKLK
jgi:TolB-like protein/Tfp pilus assembly protein PilF